MAQKKAKHRMVLSPQARTESSKLFLGARYITDHPALMSGYAWNTGCLGKIPGASSC